MTPEEIKVKNWLNRAFYVNKKINALDMLLKASVMHAEGLTRVQQYNYTSKSDTRLNGTQDAFLKLVDMERKISEQKKELENIFEEISEAIALLHDDELEAILIHRYLLFHTIEQTAEIMHYSTRAVKYKQKKAIEKLCTFLPCFAP
ncbi:MAG: hypothetical protein NC205_00910 [Prevotella sp.]|nr:hypothetical protein [Alistipes senegalensis]MCM1357123.1 hypothetical protein [Prevotella sp.]MCM1472555.1 hypothetical protein [Muribaculaceae bacterium]